MQTKQETFKDSDQFVYKKKKKKGAKMREGSKAEEAQDKEEGIKSKKAKKGFTPKGAHGRAAVHALGRTKTTGNFKKIEASKGKGAAIGAYVNALAKHQGRPAPYTGKKAKTTGKQMLSKAMKGMC